MDIPTRYSTERLILRPYVAADAPVYYQMLQHNWAHLLEFMSPEMMNARNAQDIEAFFQWQAKEWQQRNLFILGMWKRVSTEYVGEVYLANPDWDVPCIEIGYFLIQSATGQGYATEAARRAVRIAFEHMQVQRVELQCKADNENSARVAIRCGFTLEGRLRQRNHKKDGTRVDRLWFGLLRSEWET
jgi:RimJ/RimL family protein N-acetyltransferase